MSVMGASGEAWPAWGSPRGVGGREGAGDSRAEGHMTLCNWGQD